MLSTNAGKLRAALSLLRVAGLAAALSLGACVQQQTPPPAATGEPDPALQGHAQWCNTNPPSGYCAIDDHR
jgi:hypothetical protein